MKKLFFTGGGGAGNEAMWRYFNNDYDVLFGDADIQSIDLAIPQTNMHKIPYENSQLSIVKSGIQIRRHWRNYIFSSN